MKFPLPRQYLGDGVTAIFDGFHIWLTTPRDGAEHEIALEPSVFKALTEFADRAWASKPSSDVQDRPPSPQQKGTDDE